MYCVKPQQKTQKRSKRYKFIKALKDACQVEEAYLKALKESTADNSKLTRDYFIKNLIKTQ